MSITVEKRFQITEWNSFTNYKTIDFWTRRRFKFIEANGCILTAKRGNLLGNLISLDMSRLISTLTVTVSSDNEIRCVLKVNTFMQIITDYNRAWWDLEMEMFESFMLETDEQNERWENFQDKHKKAALAWALSSGILGRKIPPGEKP
jgi:hypothetical protein